MTPLMLLAILSSMLLAAALLGPRLIAKATPALASMPRSAAAALSTGALLWITGLLFLGPVVAWIGVGPEWLPAQATEICQRCLAATSPFGKSDATYIIPAFIPLSLPFAGVGLLIAGVIREWRATVRANREIIEHVVATSTPTTLHGHQVWLTNEQGVHAFALSAGRGGIVVSRDTIEMLSREELASVLAHEQAHIDQRHHAWLMLLRGTTHYLRWIPLIESVRGAVPPFLEIAADQAAGRATARDGVASALLKLSQLEVSALRVGLLPTPPAAFNAVGSARIRTLVGAPHPKGSRALATTLLACGAMLFVAVGTVHWPYVLALLTGC